VATGGARRGRRDNGLVAAEYAAAGDVDPRVGEHLLDVLGLRGIAAYLQPAADLHPVTRSTTLPDRPTDRLFVDRTHVETARSFLQQLTGAEAESATDLAATDLASAERSGATDRPTGPEPAGARDQGARDQSPRDPATSRDRPERGDPELGGDSAASAPAGDPTSADIDELFAAIVAGYDNDAAGTVWPDAENLPPERATGVGRALTVDPEPGADPTGPQYSDDKHPGDKHPGDQSRTLRRWQDSTIRPDGWRSPTDDRGLLEGLDGLEPEFDGDDEEGYTPPPPPPLPKIAPATIVAVLAIIAGVVIFFNPRLLPVDETVAMVFGFCGILGGFVALIWRLRPGDDDDDHWDPNDGAVV